MRSLHHFTEIWLVDFEFIADPGEAPDPVCMVAHELRSGRTLRVWRDDWGECHIEPRSDVLLVAYHAPAELGCFLSLGWPLPLRVLDLCAEFKCHTSGRRPTVGGRTLLGALAFYGLPSIEAVDKDRMRDLIMDGGPWSNEDRAAILDYCETDVTALGQLLPKMLPDISVGHAILRGRYTCAVARMERRGIPMDAPLHKRLQEEWPTLKLALISKIDTDFDVYEGTTFKMVKWERYLKRERISWPRLESGQLCTDDDTFKQMCRPYPQVAPLRELRHSLQQMRFAPITVGKDGRNRTMLSPFASITGRNQPSSTRFIFGTSVWLRGLIKPSRGQAIAYIDYSQQEFGIAAYLSKDPEMIVAYESGDAYLKFAIQAGSAPKGATRESHGHIREQFKTISLGVQYGMGVGLLASRLNKSPAHAMRLLAKHHETYPRFWEWSDSAIDCMELKRCLHAALGWKLFAGENIRPGTIRNFPMQANGSEMMRLACSIATERGVLICCPIHDALLIEAPAKQIMAAAAQCQEAMEEASGVVLAGPRIRTDAKIVVYPDRYEDPRGRRMWEVVMGLLGKEKTQVLASQEIQVVR